MHNKLVRIIGIFLLIGVFLVSFVSFPHSSVNANLEPFLASTPSPVAPAGIITATSPTFKWSKDVQAIKYKFEVYKGANRIYLSPNIMLCAKTICSYKLPATLEHSTYKWHVKAYYTDGWKDWSAFKTFIVTPPATSFNSQFNGSMDNWARKAGGEWNVNSTSLFTTGLDGKMTSAYNKTSGAYKNFEYSVRMKRIGEDQHKTKPMNYLVFRAGTNIDPLYYGWYPAYYFGYSNGYIYTVAYCRNFDDVCETLVPRTETISINPYGWNTLRVVVEGPIMSFYINGSLQTSIVNDSRSIGYVGISMQKYEGTSTSLLVDWAKLEVIPTP